jgi:hypothetical protein
VTSAIDPTIYGNVQMNLAGNMTYTPQIAEPTVKMRELWIYDDKVDDYVCVTIADPDIVIYDRASKSLFLQGEQPFVQICPSPQYDYYYGQSETQRLVFLQEMRNKRTGQILELLDKQVNPPKAFIGFQGILDEKMFALNRANGMVASDMPNAKVEEFTPNIPNDLFRELGEIDAMFAEASGITSVLSGRGDEDGNEFIAAQFTNDFVVKVDAHSNSPIFMEDARDLAFSLYNAGAISKSALLEMVEPPMKDRLVEEVKAIEAAAAMQQMMQAQQAPQAAEAQPEQPPLRAVQ